MTIGYVNPEYGAVRNIIGRCSSCRYARVRSITSLKSKIFAKVGFPGSGLQPYAFRGGVVEGFRHVDLMHFWNTICLSPSRKPYITSFETTAPRAFKDDRMVRRGLESLLSSKCRMLIAITQHAKLRQISFDAEHGISDLDQKITVFLPPQDVLISEDELLRKSTILEGKLSSLRLIFVGKDFLGKVAPKL